MSKNTSYLVAVLGPTHGIIGQHYARKETDAIKCFECLLLEYFGEKGKARILSNEAEPGIWVEGLTPDLELMLAACGA